MTTWGRINEINPRIEETWKSRFFLTIDIDWAADFVIEYCKTFIEDLGVPSTWFLTHEGEELSSLIHPGIERGTHCNFLPNLNRLTILFIGNRILDHSLLKNDENCA